MALKRLSMIFAISPKFWTPSAPLQTGEKSSSFRSSRSPKQKKPRLRKIKAAVEKAAQATCSAILSRSTRLIAVGAKPFCPQAATGGRSFGACSGNWHASKPSSPPPLEKHTRSIPHRLVHLVQEAGEAVVRGKQGQAVGWCQISNPLWRMVFHFFIASVGDAYQPKVEIVIAFRQKNIKEDNGFAPRAVCADRIYIFARIRHFCHGETDPGFSGKPFGAFPQKNPELNAARKQQLNC